MSPLEEDEIDWNFLAEPLFRDLTYTGIWGVVSRLNENIWERLLLKPLRSGLIIENDEK